MTRKRNDLTKIAADSSDKEDAVDVETGRVEMESFLPKKTDEAATKSARLVRVEAVTRPNDDRLPWVKFSKAKDGDGGLLFSYVNRDGIFGPTALRKGMKLISMNGKNFEHCSDSSSINDMIASIQPGEKVEIIANRLPRPPPPGLREGGVWLTKTYVGERTGTEACLCCFLCGGPIGASILCCNPYDKKWVYMLNGVVYEEDGTRKAAGCCCWYLRKEEFDGPVDDEKRSNACKLAGIAVGALLMIRLLASY